MTAEMPATVANADQIESWNTRTGLRWAALQARIDALFVPVTTALLDFAAPGEGARVLDIGCGCGATVLEIARLVGPAGRVLGVDVSEPMLAVARQRVAAAGADHAQLLLADAAIHAFEPSAFDAMISRFGVMFFGDPAAAFRNIRTALVPGGRLAFVCWQPLQANPWFREPVEAVLPLLGPLPAPDPIAPGPFAFADPDRVRAILAAAGWSDVAVAPAVTSVTLGGAGEAATFVTQVGAAARLLTDAPPDVQVAAREAVRTRLAALEGPDGIRLGAAMWLVSARA